MLIWVRLYTNQSAIKNEHVYEERRDGVIRFVCLGCTAKQDGDQEACKICIIDIILPYVLSLHR